MIFVIYAKNYCFRMLISSFGGGPQSAQNCSWDLKDRQAIWYLLDLQQYLGYQKRLLLQVMMCLEAHRIFCGFQERLAMASPVRTKGLQKVFSNFTSKKTQKFLTSRQTWGISQKNVESLPKYFWLKVRKIFRMFVEKNA